RLDVDEPTNLMLVAPGKKPGHGMVISLARVLIADGGAKNASKRRPACSPASTMSVGTTGQLPDARVLDSAATRAFDLSRFTFDVIISGLDHGVGHPTAASELRHSPAALGAKRVRGHRCKAESSRDGRDSPQHCNLTCSRPSPHRRGCLFCMGVSAQ